jgi:Flp pilus assembly protein TadG
VRSGRRRRRDDEGSVLAEFAVVLPALMLLLLGVFQFAAWYLASEVALGAAQEAARAARVEGGSAGDGEQAAWRFIDQANGGHLVGPRVIVNRGANAVRVEVDGRAQSLLPGLVLGVRESAAGEVERFRGDEEG